MRAASILYVVASVVLALVLLALCAAAPTAAASDRAAASPTTVDGSPPVTVAEGVDAKWHRSAVSVTFTATSQTAAIAATFVQVDGGAPVATTRVVVRAPRNHANDGEHVLTFWSVDADGRQEAPQSVTVKIDTRPPVVSRLRLRPNVLHSVRPFRVTFQLADSTGGARVSYEVVDQYWRKARRGRGVRLANGRCVVAIPNRYANGHAFVPGLYRVTLTLADSAGNRHTTRQLLLRDFHPVRTEIAHSVPGAGRRIALTFDDGGSSWVWARMLDVLKAYRMRATFFLVGPYVSATPRLARRTLREGHAIGSHGWTHALMTSQGYAGVRAELLRSEAAWWRAARATPVAWFRPPYGQWNEETRRAAGSLGFKHLVLWDVDPGDWRGLGAGAIAAATLSHVHNGAIVCLHVRPTTLGALPAILRGLRARGYVSVTLPELFRAADRR